MKIDLTKSVLIDNHAHSLLKRPLEIDVIGFRRAFTESNSMSIIQNHVPNSLHYMNMLEQLREIVSFNTEEELIELRQKSTTAAHVNELWDDASIGALLVDDGYLQPSMMPISELSKVCERPVYRILRIETLLEKLFNESKTFSELEDALDAQLRSLDSSRVRVVGLKTVAAYRGGLPSDPHARSVSSKADFDSIKKSVELSKISFRMTKHPLYEQLLLQSFEIAGRLNLPIQVHTGIGDTDLVLHESNPTVMTPILKDKRFAACRFVFLHCYPYHREAAYLCSVFPNCYLDLSLTSILVSAAFRNILFETIASAPTSKILAGTDGHSIPEMHWYGAITLKNNLSAVLNQLVSENYLKSVDAQRVAENILYANCRELYQLEGLL
ncbi:MAG: amidohydrolase family protein [Candidatus Melainabacteria bacterium]|nr:amidohydrolase family protein [Candidatus Melainabacteria bacterium]